MGIAEQHNIPVKKVESEPWSMKRLFPFANAVSAFSKTFVSPFDILLGFLIFIVGISELIGHRVSWSMWVFITLILLATLLERYIAPPAVESKKEKTKPKS